MQSKATIKAAGVKLPSEAWIQIPSAGVQKRPRIAIVEWIGNAGSYSARELPQRRSNSSWYVFGHPESNRAYIRLNAVQRRNPADYRFPRNLQCINIGRRQTRRYTYKSYTWYQPSSLIASPAYMSSDEGVVLHVITL